MTFQAINTGEFYYSKIINPAEFNRIMTDEHLYIKNADDYIIQIVINNTNTQECPEIVELGCGPGRLLAPISEALSQARITGIDIDEDFLTHAEKITSGFQTRIFCTDVETYRHDAPVDAFVSQGMHHHIAKGDKTERYLNNIYEQLKPGGCYILSDEFLPDYNSVSEREIATVIWHSHIIAHALRNNYNYLANEEAKTLLDDIYEGRSKPSCKSYAQIDCVLKFVEQINYLIINKLQEEAVEKAKEFLSNLEELHSLVRLGDERIDLSRQDFKICSRDFLDEVSKSNFNIESCKEFGNLSRFGGFAIWVLRK